MANPTGGEVVAQALAANGIEILFGIPGVQLDPVFAGLHDVRDRIRMWDPLESTCRHASLSIL